MFISLVHTVVLASALFMEPPASPAGGGDILRGPDVPTDALKAAAKDKSAGQGQATDKVARPQLEQRVLFMTLDKLELNPEKRKAVDAARADFTAAVDAFEKDAAVKRKEIFEKRKKEAEPGKPPSEDFKKAMEELEAKRPKLASLKEKLTTILSRDELLRLKSSYEDGLKRAREELTRREEEARKLDAERRKQKAVEEKAVEEKTVEEKAAEEKDRREKGNDDAPMKDGEKQP